MELEDLFKELSKNQKTLALSFLIHFPLVYTIGFYLYPDIISFDLFPQLMFVSAFSFVTVMAEAAIALIANLGIDKNYSLFPTIWIIFIEFLAASFFYVAGVLTLRLVILTYIICVFLACIVAFYHVAQMHSIKKEAKNKNNHEKKQDEDSV